MPLKFLKKENLYPNHHDQTAWQQKSLEGEGWWAWASGYNPDISMTVRLIHALGKWKLLWF